MKSTNFEEQNTKTNAKMRIAKVAGDLLTKDNFKREPSCNLIFLYEPEVPLDVLMSQKED